MFSGIWVLEQQSDRVKGESAGKDNSINLEKFFYAVQLDKCIWKLWKNELHSHTWLIAIAAQR